MHQKKDLEQWEAIRRTNEFVLRGEGKNGERCGKVSRVIFGMCFTWDFSVLSEMYDIYCAYFCSNWILWCRD